MASVVLNLLLNSIDEDRKTAKDKELVLGEDGKPVNPLTLESQQARSDIVATLVGAIATAAGLDTASAVTVAQIETQNNDELVTPVGTIPTAAEGGSEWEVWKVENRELYEAGLAEKNGDEIALRLHLGNIDEDVTDLARGAAINVLQSLTESKVKTIADSLKDTDGKSTVGSEGMRAELQAIG